MRGLPGQHGALAAVLGPALQRVKELAPDAIALAFAVTDEGKGWQFIEQLRRDQKTADVQVILCTTPVGLTEACALRLDVLGVSVAPPPSDLDAVKAEIHRALGDAHDADRMHAFG